MARFYNLLFSLMWGSWLAFWWIRSREVKITSRRESRSSRRSYSVPLLLAVCLLFPPLLPPIPLLSERFLPLSHWQVWGGVGAAMTLAGLLFTVWARIHLGRDWSDAVTLKQDHSLVTTGPYAIVRHPIYTGLLIALVGQTVSRGEWRGIIALVLATWGFWLKLRIEESWMRELFGTDYARYSERVPALIPGIV